MENTQTHGGVVSNTSKLVKATSVGVHGRGLCVPLTSAIKEWTNWQRGDTIAVRQAGEKLVLERVNMDSLCRIRTGEVQANG